MTEWRVDMISMYVYCQGGDLTVALFENCRNRCHSQVAVTCLFARGTGFYFFRVLTMVAAGDHRSV